MSAIDLDPRTRLCHLERDFALHHGRSLPAAQVAFALEGPADAPVVAVLGGISGGRRVTRTPAGPGWWQALAGPGRAVDTTRYRVLGLDWLGGAGASTGPDNGGPRPFPAVATRDQARALAAVLDELGVDRLHLLVGASYGGQVGQAFAVGHPGRLRHLVCLCAGHRPHPPASAWRGVQRRILEWGMRHGDPAGATDLARQLAMTTYRGERGLALRFAGAPRFEGPRVRFPVDAYLEARGAAFAAAFPAAAFHCLSQSIDLHGIDPAHLTVPLTCVVVRGDRLVPVGDGRDLVAACAAPAGLVEIDSPHGHDAFLLEVDALAPVLRRALAGEVAK